MPALPFLRAVMRRDSEGPPARAGDQRGAVMVLVAGGMVVLLGMAGLVLDSGRAFLVKSQLSRAVDAGVLAGARSIRAGEETARREAIAVARANGVFEGDRGTHLEVSFGQNANLENTVTVTARRPMRTALMRLVGQPIVQVASTATAVVPPIDLVFVTDQSTSIEDMGAWEPLKEAARELVTFFDDELDQMGLVSFGVRAAHRHRLSHDFTLEVLRGIDDMRPMYWTNAADGLRLAHEQLTGPDVRERAIKVVIFFTDGQPTAAHTAVGGEHRIITAWDRDASGRKIGGYYNNPGSIRMDVKRSADGCLSDLERIFCPVWTEAGPAPHGPVARKVARASARLQAARLRADGIYIYTIALGNPDAGNPLMRPDIDLLKELSNEHEIADPDQPSGRTYFAPSIAELRQVFRQAAQDLVVRLSH